MISKLTAFSAALFVCGCVNTTVGRPLAKDSLKDVIPGRTSGDEVRQLFGEPLHKARNGDREVWTYRHVEEGGRFQELILTLDADQVTVWSDNSRDW